MRYFPVTFMRGGTSKGCVFNRSDLPHDSSDWDFVFLQCMGNPDPKQIDGLGGTVSSNNKIVVVWKSNQPDVDVEYLVGQVVVGKNQVDYKSNCGNMTSAVGPYAVDKGLVSITEPITKVRAYNQNTDKRIDILVPIDAKTKNFAQTGSCTIAGIEGSAAEILVSFLSPAGSKTGTLFPTGNTKDVLEIPGYDAISTTILDVSNPIVLVRAEDVGLRMDEMPEDINAMTNLCDFLERIRGTACCKMGFARDLDEARGDCPAVPKIAVVSAPKDYTDIAGKAVKKESMDLCVRVMSIFKCHKATPITAAAAIGVASLIYGTTAYDCISNLEIAGTVRLGHPSGVIRVCPKVEWEDMQPCVVEVGVQRTARKIMDGTVYIPF